MKRHDTHILSDSEEEEEKSEKRHKYSFNDSQSSDKSSEKNISYSNTKKNSPFKLENLKVNNNNNNNINSNNVSIISIKEIEDIFYNEKSLSLNTKNNIKIKKDDNNKKKDINKNKNIKLVNKIINKKDSENIKIKILKINDNKNEKSNILFTYTPSLINKLNIKQYFKKRNCISLTSSLHKSKKIIKQLKNINTKSSNRSNKSNKSIKSIKSKRIKISSDYKNSIINNSTSNNKEKKNIKNLIDIINQRKIKTLKVCKNSFSIKTKNKKINPILLDDYQKIGIYNNMVKNEYPFELNHKIQHQNDFYLEQKNDHTIKRFNFFPPCNYEIDRRRKLQYLQPNNDNNDNYYYSSKYVINNNNSQYCMSSLNKFSKRKKSKNSRLKLKNDKKIKILYDLYCGKPNTNIKNIQRIKSALSVNRQQDKRDMYKRMNEFNLLKNNLNIKKQNKKNSEYIYNNKQNWLFRLIKLKKVKTICPYDKHFGNNESCPLCQEMEKKNEESIIQKGISPNPASANKNESKTSLQKRRIYSASSKNYAMRNKNESSKSDILGDYENENNKTRNLNTNKSGFGSVMINEKNNKTKKITFNMIKRKIKFNKDIYQDSYFSYSNNNNL